MLLEMHYLDFERVRLLDAHKKAWHKHTTKLNSVHESAISNFNDPHGFGGKFSGGHIATVVHKVRPRLDAEMKKTDQTIYAIDAHCKWGAHTGDYKGGIFGNVLLRKCEPRPFARRTHTSSGEQCSVESMCTAGPVLPARIIQNEIANSSLTIFLGLRSEFDAVAAKLSDEQATEADPCRSSSGEHLDRVLWAIRGE